MTALALRSEGSAPLPPRGIGHRRLRSISAPSPSSSSPGVARAGRTLQDYAAPAKQAVSLLSGGLAAESAGGGRGAGTTVVAGSPAHDLAMLLACACNACNAWPSQRLCQGLARLWSHSHPPLTRQVTSASCSADHTFPQVVVVVPKPKVVVCSGEIAKLCWCVRMLEEAGGKFG